MTNNKLESVAKVEGKKAIDLGHLIAELKAAKLRMDALNSTKGGK